MKTQRLGISIATLALALSAAAAPSVRPIDVNNYKTEILNYRDQMLKPSLFGKETLPLSSLSREAVSSARAKLIESFKVNGTERSGLESFLESGARLEKALDVIAQMKVGKLLSERADTASQDLGRSLSKSASAQMKTMASANLNGARAVKKSMKQEEMSQADLAADKYIEMPESLLKMEPTKRDMWSEVFLARADLIGQGRHNGAEALLQATMQVRKVDRDTAMEIIRRMAGCK